LGSLIFSAKTLAELDHYNSDHHKQYDKTPLKAVDQPPARHKKG